MPFFPRNTSYTINLIPSFVFAFTGCVFLFFYRFQTILQSFWGFSVSVCLCFLRAFDVPGRKNVFLKTPLGRYCSTFPALNFLNQLLWPFPTLFDAKDVGFRFLGRFNVLPSPDQTFLRLWIVSVRLGRSFRICVHINISIVTIAVEIWFHLLSELFKY